MNSHESQFPKVECGCAHYKTGQIRIPYDASAAPGSSPYFYIRTREKRVKLKGYLEFECLYDRHKVFIIKRLERELRFLAHSRRNFPTSGTERDQREILRSELRAEIVRILCSRIARCPFAESPRSRAAPSGSGEQKREWLPVADDTSMGIQTASMREDHKSN